MHLYVYDCVIHWDVHVGYSGSRCCAQNFGTAGCRNNGPSEHCHGTTYTMQQSVTQTLGLLPLGFSPFHWDDLKS